MGFLDNKYLLRSETALALYNAIGKLPIVDPHNHANVKELAENKKYSDPWQLFAATDHYVWEVLRKRDVPEEYITGNADPEEKWIKMAAVFPEIAGNPVYEWIHLDLKRYLGINTILAPATGKEIWEQAQAVLAIKSKRPQELLKEINIEVMCSTDDPVDLLEDHDKLNKAMDKTIVRPTWRPDKAVNIKSENWKSYMDKLAKRFNMEFNSIKDLTAALKMSHDYFAKRNCVASDHAVVAPLSADADIKNADAAFKSAMNGKALTETEASCYMNYIFGEIAELDSQKDWVFQLHIGAVRDVRDSIYKTLGPDAGGDVSDHYIDILSPLKKFLNRFDNRLKTVLYCLEPGHQATLATISRAFGSKVRLGSAWWLCDHPIGMKRQLEYIGAVDLFSNFAGMVSDSRKLLSYGSRFEMFRRVLSDVIGEMVELGQMPYAPAEELAKKMAYYGPKEFFNL
ncbi:MAG: glucuronate isomerase [Lentisphaerae bacterium GWF2_45_14]|nr:MAG: glucuronate isomerase [Lentisphaerae bacterium GWF2_45_14]